MSAQRTESRETPPSALTCMNGKPISPVGLGTWKIESSRVSSLVHAALEEGYRHLDCACDYGNEHAVGAGIFAALQAGVCQRDDVWITSKLWNTFHAREHVRPAVEKTLADLGIDYLDAYLIHFPIALKYVPFDTRYPPEWLYDPEADDPRMEFAQVPIVETWQAMEDLVRDGLVRHIGVCNFNTSLLRDLLNAATIRPAMLQVEMHPFLTQEQLLRYCREEEIAVTAFSPFGASSYLELGMAHENESVLQEPLIQTIAEQVGRTAAQIALRWGVQRGTLVIPKTNQVGRLAENRGVFDFELSADQMDKINALNRNRRFNDPGVFCASAFNTFCPIYE